MVSNAIKITFGSFLLFSIVSCVNETKNKPDVVVKKTTTDTCRYYAYDAKNIISNLGCYNCHIWLVIGYMTYQPLRNSLQWIV